MDRIRKGAARKINFRSELFDTTLLCLDEILGTSSIQTLLELEPAPSREQLISGLKRTISQIPLLRCRLEPGLWRDRWVVLQDLNPEDLVEVEELSGDVSKENFEDQAYAAFFERACEPINLLHGPPIKLLLFRSSSQGLLVIRVHHALADGNGCMQLAGLVGQNLLAEPNAPLPEAIIMDRSFGQLWNSFGIRDFPGLFNELAREALRPLIMPFMKPLKEEPADKPGLLEPSITRLVIQGDDYQSLQGVARKNGLTINDFLAVALLGLAGEFNASLSRPSSYLCVLFTVNLRRFLKTTGIQIANISGISIFTSRQERAGSFKAAVNEVREKVGELKRHYLGLGFMLVPQLTTYLMPSLLMHAFIKRYGGFVLRQTARHALAMTNFGEMATCLDPFGDRLRNASAIAPIYDLPFPLLTVTGYRNRLTIFFAHLYRHEKDAGLGQRMAERMRYYLLEWPGVSK